MDSDDAELLAADLVTATTRGSIKLLVGSCLVAIIAYWAQRNDVLHGARIWSRPYVHRLLHPGFIDHSIDPSAEDACFRDDPMPAIRTKFGSLATIVYGWPSTGGVWVHTTCYGVELDFLGLSRFEPSATERYPAAEDEFCKRLEWIGGHFYESEHAYVRPKSHRRTPLSWYGWSGAVPEGGVWVLRTGEHEGAEMGVSRIRNALTMEERCRAIELLGGKFYESWEDVPAEQFVDDGVKLHI